MAKRKNFLSEHMPLWAPPIGVVALVLLIATLLKGRTIAVLSPKGLIASEQRQLLFVSVLLLLLIAVPTLAIFFHTAWKYREGNVKVTRNVHAHHHSTLVFTIWALPIVTMLFLASIMWPAAHDLAPQKAIASDNPPLTIQVIALRWKWLFIYPEQNIATINYVQIPTDTPVQFDITADEMPMSSFWIPQLSGQLYAMTGHVNRLNILADKTGDYAGSSAEINGAGFAGMKFTAHASTMDDFTSWVQSVKGSSAILDSAEYQKLLKPTEYNKTVLYSQAGAEVYDTMLAKYSGSHGQHTNTEHSE